MLDVTVIMNSSMEEVLAFKCCNLPNQNFEIHVRNLGDRPVVVPGYMVLENDEGSTRYDNLYPPWKQKVDPGEAVAFYSSMEEKTWQRCRSITVFDDDGKGYRFPVSHAKRAS